MQLLQHGNQKLASYILNLSIPPGKGCFDNSQCFNTCYAYKFYRRLKNVRDAWERNWDLTQKPNEMIEQISAELTAFDKRSRQPERVVRVHVAGDFYNTPYLLAWETIILRFPQYLFFGYTRDELAYRLLNYHDNCNFKSSFLPDGSNNYGPSDYVFDKLEEFGDKLFVCPATSPEFSGRKIVCGRDCLHCLQTPDEDQQVIFFQH